MMCSGGGGISKLVPCISGSRFACIEYSFIGRIYLLLSDKQERGNTMLALPLQLHIECTRPGSFPLAAKVGNNVSLQAKVTAQRLLLLLLLQYVCLRM